MAQQKSVAAGAPYTPAFDRNPPGKHDRLVERILMWASLLALLFGTLAFMGVKVSGPADIEVQVQTNTQDIAALNRVADSLARGQRTTNYIVCALYVQQFPATPKPEGCP